MEALLYLFKHQVILFIIIICTFLIVAFLPKKILKRKKWGWRLILVELIVFIFLFWLHTRPKEYERHYLKNDNKPSITLLEQAEKSNVYIGTAFTNSIISQNISKQFFNSITPDNPLKWGRTVSHGNIYDYDYTKADSIVNFALENQLRIRGHVLVWGRAVDFFKKPDLRQLLSDFLKKICLIPLGI